MKTVYIVDSPLMHSDRTRFERTPYGLQKKYGYRIPGVGRCPVCRTHMNSPQQYHHRFELPMPCPPEIIEESEHLISTTAWDKSLGHPKFDREVLFPYLQKWTGILRDMGYDLDRTIRPGSNFAPDFFYPREEDFVDGDLVKVYRGGGRPGWFVSERMKESLEVCGGIAFREVMPRRKTKYFNLLCDYPRFIEFMELFKEVEEAPKGHVAHCDKCGCGKISKDALRMLDAKIEYFCENKIFPAHLLEEGIDIFPHFSRDGSDCIVLSAKAFSIVTKFENPGLNVTEYEVVGSPLWFDDDYWKSIVRGQGEEESIAATQVLIGTPRKGANEGKQPEITGEGAKAVVVVLLAHNTDEGGLFYAAEDPAKDLAWPIPAILKSAADELGDPLEQADAALAQRMREAVEAGNDSIDTDPELPGAGQYTLVRHEVVISDGQ